MIRTVAQYLASLNDGREMWCMGEKVNDVRTHPTLSGIIRTAALDYVIPHRPEYRDLFVTRDENGEEVNFLLTAPQSADDAQEVAMPPVDESYASIPKTA